MTKRRKRGELLRSMIDTARRSWGDGLDVRGPVLVAWAVLLGRKRWTRQMVAEVEREIAAR
jgi:hypothetical protein